MATSEDKGFINRLGEILNTPLPGTQAPTTPAQSQGGPQAAGDDGLLGRIRDILSQPLPGTAPAGAGAPGTPSNPQAPVESQVQAQPRTEHTPQPQGQVAQPSGDLSAGTLGEDWWRQDWAAYEAHRAEESRGLALEQGQDKAKFEAFQAQERQRFAEHQQQEAEQFHQYQQWKLNAWNLYQESIRAGRPLPPPPFLMPPGTPQGMMPPGPGPDMRRPPGGPMPGSGGPFGGPMGPLPPWMRGPR